MIVVAIAPKTSLVDSLVTELKSVSKDNLPGKSTGIVAAFLERFKEMVSHGLGIQYFKTKNSVARESGTTLVPTDSDINIINSYVNSPFLRESYTNLSKAMSLKVNSILASSFDKGIFSPAEAKKRLLVEMPVLSKSRVNTILRTEYSNIQNISAERTYRELGLEDAKFIMLGPTDFRTADSTMEVKHRQGRGLTMDALKELVKDVAMKYTKTYDPNRPWIIHINTRHRLQRVA